MTGRGEVTVFAPSPIVTVTVEDRRSRSAMVGDSRPVVAASV